MSLRSNSHWLDGKRPLIEILESVLDDESETTEEFISTIEYYLHNIDRGDEYEDELDELRSIESLDDLVERVKEMIQEYKESKPT